MTSKCDLEVTFTQEGIVGKLNSLAPFPINYVEYNKSLLRETHTLLSKAETARIRGLDPSFQVECELALDLADRVEHLIKIPLAERLREFLRKYRTEQAALAIAEEVALGKFGFYDKEDALNYGVRVGLAVVTDGITIAPIQGVSSLKIKKNDDGTNYAAIYFAGPIRSAGGTEAAFTLVIADRLRLALGLDKYHSNTDEVGRFIEELRIYEREVGNFQFKVSDEDVRRAILHLPVEINGVETDPVEIMVHRSLKRIETDRVRGGCLRVLNDGVIGRSRKLTKLLNDLSITGWDWLADLISGKQRDVDETRVESSHFKEIISGRAVLSFPKIQGGFRLRYGRCYNTGLATVGIHPATAAILDYPVVVGTQVKLDIPGKAATIAFVDTIEPPIVRLKDGSVLRVNDGQGYSISKNIERILFLGDILVSYGDFLENNMRLPPSGYVEEWWCQELKACLEKYESTFACTVQIGINQDRLQLLLQDNQYTYPTVYESFILSEKLRIPLHPRYLFYWDLASPSDIIVLRQNLSLKSQSEDGCFLTAPNQQDVKSILEKIGVPHQVEGRSLLIKDSTAYAVMKTLNLQFQQLLINDGKNVLDFLTDISGIQIRRKSSVFVGLRAGRPEKAMLRVMKPPVHVLFPVGSKGGPSRDITQTSDEDSLEVELINAICSQCDSSTTFLKCSRCGGSTRVIRKCPNCNRIVEKDTCPTCKTAGLPYSKRDYPIKQMLKNAVSRAGYIPTPPLKGVKGLTNATRVPEALEKGLLRLKHHLSVYKDGTVRFDATNAPITHFKPSQTSTSIEKLRQLGYVKDIKGKSIESEDQLIELYTQDIIIPIEAGECLVNVTHFIDDLLIHLYAMEPYYKITSKEDLIGHLVVGLAPHTSVGVLGRIIGFTHSQVCYAHPYWHSAKRRDCDGDEDAIMLLLDVFLNFSREFLPAQIGGLMDTPLLLQPIIIPREVQRQAHNLDLASCYSVEFYNRTLKNELPQNLTDIIDIVRNRLGDQRQFQDFHFTHNTNVLFVGHPRNIYSTLKSLPEKIEKQIELATKIVAVNPDEVVSAIIKTHLLPDIIGNLSAYTSQKFRCKSCGFRYRRLPVKGVCLTCGGELQSTVSRASVEKYLRLTTKLCERFKIDEYLRRRLEIITEELSELFISGRSEFQLEMSSFLYLNEDGR